MVSLLSHSVMCCGCEVCMLKAGLVTENVIKQTCSDFNCYFGESWDCMSTNLYIFNCSLNIINCKFSYLSKLSLHTFKLLLQQLQTKTFSYQQNRTSLKAFSYTSDHLSFKHVYSKKCSLNNAHFHTV